MQTDPQLVGNEELSWYAEHRDTIRHINWQLLNVHGELAGGLLADLMSGNNAYYLAAKYAFIEPGADVIPNLEALYNILPSNNNSRIRLSALRVAIGETIEYGKNHLEGSREGCLDSTLVENFQQLLKKVLKMIDDFRASLEITLLTSQTF